MMHNLQWDVKSFQELSVSQFFEVLQLRVNVFVVEQQCAYPELDEHDRHAETRHLAGRDVSGQVIAYARVLPAFVIPFNGFTNAGFDFSAIRA